MNTKALEALQAESAHARYDLSKIMGICQKAYSLGVEELCEVIDTFEGTSRVSQNTLIQNVFMCISSDEHRVYLKTRYNF